MKKTRHTLEQIIVKLREVKILIAQRKTIGEVSMTIYQLQMLSG